MIATRLAAVWQVAGVAGAALCCYLVSSTVATQRAGLTKVDRQIVVERDAIARLETEIATRSRLTQVENWNRQLALQAPRPAQYVSNGFQLASLYAHDGRPALPLDPAIVPQGPIQQAAYRPTPTPTPAPELARAAPALPPITVASIPPAATPKAPRPRVVSPAIIQVAARQDASPQPLLRAAAYVRPKSSRLADDAPAAMVKASFHGGGSLLPADIASLAAAERGGEDNGGRARR